MILEKIKTIHGNILRNILKLISGEVSSIILIEKELLEDVKVSDLENQSVWEAIEHLVLDDQKHPIAYGADQIQLIQKIERSINERGSQGNFSENFIDWLTQLGYLNLNQPAQKTESDQQEITSLKESISESLKEEEIKVDTAPVLPEKNVQAPSTPVISIDEIKNELSKINEAYEHQKLDQISPAVLIKHLQNFSLSLNTKLTSEFSSIINNALSNPLDLTQLAQWTQRILFINKNIEQCQKLTSIDQIDELMRAEIIEDTYSSFNHYLIEFFEKFSGIISSGRTLSNKDQKFLSRVPSTLKLMNLEHSLAIELTCQFLEESLIENEIKLNLIGLMLSVLKNNQTDETLKNQWYQQVGLKTQPAEIQSKIEETELIEDQSEVLNTSESQEETVNTFEIQRNSLSDNNPPIQENQLDAPLQDSKIEQILDNTSETEEQAELTDDIVTAHDQTIEDSVQNTIDPMDERAQQASSASETEENENVTNNHNLVEHSLETDNEQLTAINNDLSENIAISSPSINETTSVNNVYQAIKNSPYYISGREVVEFPPKPDFDDELLSELIETFTEEAQEQLTNIDQYLIELEKNTNNEKVMLDLRRCYHTLKGSGRMSGLMEVGEIGWQVERVLNGCREGDYPLTPAILAHAKNGCDAVKASLKGSDITEEIYRMVHQANYLIAHKGIVEQSNVVSKPETSIENNTNDVEKEKNITLLHNVTESNLQDESKQLPQETATEKSISNTVESKIIYDFPNHLPNLDYSQATQLDSNLVKALNFQTTVVLSSLCRKIAFLQKNNPSQQLVDDIIFDVKSIKDRQAEINNPLTSQVAFNIEKVIHAVVHPEQNISEDTQLFLQKSLRLLKSCLSEEEPSDKKEEHLKKLAYLSYDSDLLVLNQGVLLPSCYSLAPVDNDPIDLNKLPEPTAVVPNQSQSNESNYFLNTTNVSDVNANQHSAKVPVSFDDYNNSKEKAPFSLFKYHASRLMDSFESNNATAPSFDQATQLFRKCFENSQRGVKEFTTVIEQLHDYYVVAGAPKIDVKLVEAFYYHLSSFRAHGLTPRQNVLSLWEEALKFSFGFLNKLQFSEKSKMTLIERLDNLEFIRITENLSNNEVNTASNQPASEVDQEILESFLMETREILENNQDELYMWQNEGYLATSKHIAEIRRNMHTIKGGARMVGRKDIAQLTHVLESLLDSDHIKQFANDPRNFETLQRAMDHISIMIEHDKSVKDEKAEQLLAALHFLLGNEIDLSSFDSSNTDEEIKGDVKQISQKTSQMAQSELGALRIELNQLRDITGGVAEISVLNNQIHKDNLQAYASNDELVNAISRLRIQAKRLEIETETQMASRNIKSAQNIEDFDPLELDHFSEIQQLSRALLETVEDLSTLITAVADSLDKMSFSIEKQKILQENVIQLLTYVRAMNFTTVVPRFRKLIRQTADSVNKKVELKTEGTDTQVERTILDQLIAPLEHIVTNAVFHGIESPEVRLSKGKPEKGMIKISVERSGSELIVSIEDDGAGFNLSKIKAKAVADGLIKEHQTISDNDLIKLILLPGFSTADSVSQIAGRGVGLDVLGRALKILRARVDIQNKVNKGVIFSIHIPFTLAVTEALLVKSHNITYAIPLVSMEGVGKPSEAVINARGASVFGYGNDEYLVHTLANLFNFPVEKNPQQESELVLVKTNNLNLAIEVDEVVGHQEIILRPLNPQIADIPGLAGTAVMPDGSLILVLDFGNLTSHQFILNKLDPDNMTKSSEYTQIYESEKLGNNQTESRIEDEVTTEQIILVVDDSITMRKVSTRMLEKAGYKVMTAKDGIDATEKLSEQPLPDLIMLDIEMPRMDGFGVLSFVRENEKTRKIPVIMVTSRTGEKHREKALSLGASEYCGKPYQEEQMLKLIDRLLHSYYS